MNQKYFAFWVLPIMFLPHEFSLGIRILFFLILLETPKCEKITILDFSLLLPIWLLLFQLCDSKSCGSKPLCFIFVWFCRMVHGFFSVLLSVWQQQKNTVIFLLSPLRARKDDNYRYRDSWKSINFRERAIKKEK